jgi:Alginate lyase
MQSEFSPFGLSTRRRMNPNLEHGQAIRGINDGRGTGLIDTTSLIHCVQGLALLESEGGVHPDVLNGVRGWFRDFLGWMTTSSKGLAEKKVGEQSRDLVGGTSGRLRLLRSRRDHIAHGV